MRVEAIVEKPEKQRQVNLAFLKKVDESENPVEWIVSVSMLTEVWDVKNVFQIVPYGSRAFNSKLLIAQVLGRGLRVPLGMQQPLVTINNHEKWSRRSPTCSGKCSKSRTNSVGAMCQRRLNTCSRCSIWSMNLSRRPWRPRRNRQGAGLAVQTAGPEDYGDEPVLRDRHADDGG